MSLLSIPVFAFENWFSLGGVFATARKQTADQSLHRANKLWWRIDGTEVYVQAGDLSHALMEMPNAAGEVLRSEAMELIHHTVEQATGASTSEQEETLATALAHCTEEDSSAIEMLLDQTLERVREYFQNRTNA